MESTETTIWRPQAFGGRNVREIADPLIEPLWIGDRVVVQISGDDVEILDVDGKPVMKDTNDIRPQLLGAARAVSLVLDGYLTRQATPQPGTVYLVGSELPTASQMTSQMLVGRGLKSKAMTAIEEKEKDAANQNPMAFVAVDLLSLDGQQLLDIPLLERKRLLESALAEDELIRRG